MVTFSALTLSAPQAYGQVEAERGHRAILEVGPEVERGVSEAAYRLGGAVAIEVTPIENRLELELGVTAGGPAGRRELGGDLLFKKPWRLSRAAEFMAGIGPQVSHRFGGNQLGTSVAAEIIVDFMFWPARNVGWFVEPSYSLPLRSGERSLGATVGLLVGLPK